jgi:hypothetical protein
VRFRVGQRVRIIDNSNMRGEIGEIRSQSRGKWLVYLEAMGRDIPFSETEIEPVEAEQEGS